MLRTILLVILCLRFLPIQTVKAQETKVEGNLNLPYAVISEGRQTLKQLVQFSVDSETRFTGYWPDENEDAVSKSTSQFRGDLIPGGKLVASFKPYAIPWTNGVGKLYAQDTEVSYDGEKVTNLTLAVGPFGSLVKRLEAEISSDTGLLDIKLEQMLGLQGFIGIAAFQGLGGVWKDITNWSSVPKDLMSVEINKTLSELTITLADRSPSSKTKELSEILTISLSPKVGVKSYQNAIRDTEGKIQSTYELSVTEFDQSVLGPLMFPKQSKSVLKSRSSRGSGWNQTETTFIYTYHASPDDAINKFNISIPSGTNVRDNRLGVEFKVSEDPSEILQSLQRSQ